MKRVLIIGANSTIAVACARSWVANGAAFFLVSRNASKLEQTADDLRSRGAHEVSVLAFDATNLEGHAAMIQKSIAALDQIDIVLLAYGTLPDQAACERDADLAAREFAINGTSAIALLTRLATVLEAQGQGRLAVITSVAGDRGRPSNYVYGSAKAAVSTFCDGLRVRLYKSGVHVTDIRPGFVDTPMTQGLPLPRALVAKPDSVGRRIVKGIDRKVDVLYAPAFWALIMLIVRSIPRFIFKRMRL